MKAGQHVGFKEEKVLVETTLLLVQGKIQRGLCGRSNGSHTVNSFKVQKRLKSHAKQQHEMCASCRFWSILDKIGLQTPRQCQSVKVRSA